MERARPGSDARLAEKGVDFPPPPPPLLSSRHQDDGRTTSQSRVTRTKGEARPSAVNPFHTVNLVPGSAPAGSAPRNELAVTAQTSSLCG